MAFSTACSIMYTLQHLCTEERTKEEWKSLWGEKKKKDVSCDPCSGRTGILTSLIEIRFPEQLGSPPPSLLPPTPQQLQRSPCPTRGPGQEGAGQQAPHMEMGKSLGESERWPRTPGWTEVSSQAGEKSVDPWAQGCLGWRGITAEEGCEQAPQQRPFPPQFVPWVLSASSNSSKTMIWRGKQVSWFQT